MARTDVDWSVSLGPVSGPATAAAGAFVLTATARVLHWPVWVPLLVGAGVAGAVLLLCRLYGVTDRLTTFGVGCCVAAAAWSVWVVAAGWSVLALLALVLAAAVAGMVSPALATAPPPPPPALDVAAEDGYVMDRFELAWAALISRICTGKEPVTVRKVKDWPKNSGCTLDVEFTPGSAKTWEAVRNTVDSLASARRLPPGCQITAEPSPIHQGAARLHIPTINRLADDIPFPADYSPRRLADGFDVGQFGSGEETIVEVHQSSGLLAGRRGGGKTVMLQVFTAQTQRCVDATTWHADLNGGGMAAPWLTPFATGEIDTPPIDWVATSARDALAMAEAGLRIAKDRKRRYQRLMIEKNTDILPISEHLPAIIIYVDEGGEVFGEDADPIAAKAAEAFLELQRVGRAMCVNVVLSSQRGTATYLKSDVKKAVALTICTKVKDDAELANIFDWDKGLKAANLTHAGMAYIESERYPAARLYKGYGILPRQIGDVTTATIDYRPQMDAAAVEMGGKQYAGRWETPDITAFLAGLRGEPVAATVIQPRERNASSAGGLSTALATLDEGIRELREARQQQTPDSGGSDGTDDWTRSTLEGIRSLPETPEPSTPAKPEPPRTTEDRKAFVLDIIRAAGPQGIRTGEVVDRVHAANIAVRRETVSDWLRALATASAIDSPRQGWWTAR